MDVKTLRGIRIKSADKGQVSAVFSVFNVKDLDGDVTLPGAFDSHPDVPISSYGHGSTLRGDLPVGVAKIHADGAQATMEGQFFLDTPHGKAAFQTVKNLAEAGLGEWSYGYEAKEFHFGEWEADGSTVRYLTKLAAQEVSPVLKGAGIGTRTVSAKSAGMELAQEKGVSDWRSAIRPHASGLSGKSWDEDAALYGMGSDAGVGAHRTMFAWVDPTQDPEMKASYRMPHHEHAGGAASLRACVIGLALLNSGRDIGIPEGDRKGVYAHLAGHLLDHDVDVPDLSASNVGSLKLADITGLVLADLSNVRKVATETLARRTARGKGLASNSAEILGWVREELGALADLLDSPDETVAREYAAYVSRNLPTRSV